MGQSTFSRPAGDAEQGGAAGAPEGCAATERYLGRLEKSAVRSLLTVGKGKCQGLCLGRRRAVGCCLESKDLGQADHKPIQEQKASWSPEEHSVG